MLSGVYWLCLVVALVTAFLQWMLAEASAPPTGNGLNWRLRGQVFAFLRGVSALHDPRNP
jgi:hypothetical protein